MLNIGKIVRYFFGTTPQTKNKVETKTEVEHPLDILDELHNFSIPIPGISERLLNEEKELFIQEALTTYSEFELTNLLSEIYLSQRLDKNVKNQAGLCIRALVNSKSNKDLHGFISDEIYHPVARKWAINTLIERNDLSANLTFIYRVIVDSDDIGVRKLAAFGLGEIGSKAAFEVLGNVKPTDPIYPEAQEAKKKILAL